MDIAKRSMKGKALEEAKRVAIITAYLFVFLAAISVYRRLILAEYGIDYFGIVYLLFKAGVIAKVIAIGDFLRVGEESHGHPLAVTILYKTFAFALLVIVFIVVEHLLKGLFRPEGALGALRHLLVEERNETLGKVVLMFVAFIPFFALREIGRMMGPGRLQALLFKRPEAGGGEQGAGA